MTINCIHVVRDLDEASGGPSRSITQTAAALSKLGCNCHVITNQRNQSVVDLSRLNGRFNIHWLDNLKQFDSHWQACQVPSSTIVHVHGLWSGINHLACKSAHRWGVPYVVAPRGMLELWALKQRWLKKRLAFWLYQRRDLARAACLHATSAGEVASIERMNLGLPIELIPNAVELPSLGEQAAPDRTSTRRRAIFLSRIHPVKGLENLICAWSKLQKPGWECWIVGPGELAYVSQLKRLCQDLGGDSTMSFHPGVSDSEKWEVLRTAELFVLPSHSENFGMAIAEALGAGIPVITTRKTPWEEIEAHRCGWWIDDNVESLQFALKQAMSLSDGERREMGRRGRALIANNYCWPAAARKLLELYQSMLRASENAQKLR